MASISTLPPHLQERLLGELKPGESLTWVGQPKPGRFMKSGFGAWLFFIPWTAIIMINTEDIFSPLGLFFLLFGLGGLCSPFWLRRKATSTIYAITDQRSLSIEGAMSITVRSYFGSDIAGIERTEHPDGSGDLVFLTERYGDSDADRHTGQQGFLAIDDVWHVQQLIEKLPRVNHA
jgi:hypothetical protein